MPARMARGPSGALARSPVAPPRRSPTPESHASLRFYRRWPRLRVGLAATPTNAPGAKVAAVRVREGARL